MKEYDATEIAFKNGYKKGVEELTKKVADWKEIAEGYQKQFEECAEDRAKLTEENEAWQKSLITQKENADKAYYELACEVENLRAENERLKEKADRNLNNLKAVLEERSENTIVADTVQKMHSMLCEGRVSNDTVVIVANQVAKEMLEEK